MQIVKPSEIVVSDRVRTSVKNVDQMCDSIKEFGIIQPIVLTLEPDLMVANEWGEPKKRIVLVAGGRRLAALQRLNFPELRHGIEFIWREELNDGSPAIRLKLKAIEIEENVRRENLSWQEVVLGKKKLLEIMQEIHGVRGAGGATRAEIQGEAQGFSQRKLAAMLGQSTGLVSEDLKLAELITNVPELAKADTRESAMRQIKIVTTMSSMIKAGANAQKVNNQTNQDWILYEGNFQDNIQNIQAETVDLVFSDLPFGVELSQMSKHQGGSIGYSDSRESVVSDLGDIARESYRILRNDRYAIFWFGFNYYTELLSALQVAGFKVNFVPFIWFKNTRSTENPNTRYANSYDPAIIASKGSPVFIRPGQQNFANIPPVIGKLQSAQQPVELVERFLFDMTTKGATVVDLTAGSGTTGVASIKNGRRVIMFEKEPMAIQLIKARMAILK